MNDSSKDFLQKKTGSFQQVSEQVVGAHSSRGWNRPPAAPASRCRRKRALVLALVAPRRVVVGPSLHQAGVVDLVSISRVWCYWSDASTLP